MSQGQRQAEGLPLYCAPFLLISSRVAAAAKTQGSDPFLIASAVVSLVSVDFCSRLYPAVACISCMRCVAMCGRGLGYLGRGCVGRGGLC